MSLVCCALLLCLLTILLIFTLEYASWFTARSPAFSHLSATLQGLHTIRAFGSQAKFLEDFDRHQDINTAARFLFLATGRWFTVRLDLLCALFVTSVSFGSVFAAESKSISISNASYYVFLTGRTRVYLCS